MRPSLVLAAAALSVATPATAAEDPQHAPTIRCDQWRGSGVLVYGGLATVPPAHARDVVSLSIVCTYRNQADRYTILNFAPAPFVAVVGAGPMRAGTMEVCGTAVATYADGHTAVVTIGEC